MNPINPVAQSGRALVTALRVAEILRRIKKTRTAAIKLGLCALVLGNWVAAFGQSPVIISFSQNGVLVCTNLEAGSLATVEWASSGTGPWTNTWAGLDAVLVDSNGSIQVSVPMFYRVRGTPPTTNLQDIVLTTASLEVLESGATNFAVRLNAQPAATVTVTVGSDDPLAATVLPSSLTFTPANYATLQTVTVTGVSDVDTVSETVTVTMSSAGLTSRIVSVTVADDDLLGIVPSTSALTIGEAGTGNFGVRLTAQPQANTTVTVSSGDTSAATASPTSLTFTPANWNLDQTVTISGVADVDLATESVSITLSSVGLGNQTVTATVTDDDVQSVLTSPTTLTIGEAGAGNSGVRLAYQPPGNITVTVSSSDTSAATVSPASLTFTPANYATPQNVSVSGVADVDLIAESVTITASASGATSGTIGVTVTDDDVQSIDISKTTLTIGEAGSGNFDVRLAYQPPGNVTVTVSSSDTSAATVSPASLTFTPANYATPQTVTVSGVNDVDAVNESVTVTVSSPGLTSRIVNVTVLDDD